METARGSEEDHDGRTPPTAEGIRRLDPHGRHDVPSAPAIALVGSESPAGADQDHDFPAAERLLMLLTLFGSHPRMQLAAAKFQSQTKNHQLVSGLEARLTSHHKICSGPINA